MNNFNLSSLSASRMRLILIGAVILTFLAQAGLVFLGQSTIDSYGSDVSEAVQLSSANSKTLQDLELVSNTLEKHKDIVEKSSKLTVSNDDVYAYQNQIITEISAYASRAGLTTTGFTFAADVDPAAGGAAPAAATPAAGGAATTPAAPTGVTPVEVTVTFAPGATYDQLYRLLQLFEQSLLRLEVGTLSLSRPSSSAENPETQADGIGLSTLNIKVYKKK